MTWAAENTANGSGVLAAGGSVAAGTTATFSSSGFTGGASLQFANMAPAAGATLYLNFSSGDSANLAGGQLGGGGTTDNLGSLSWTSGSVVGSGGLTNQGNVAINGNGGQSVGTYVYSYQWNLVPGVLSNSGTITHGADGVLGISQSSTLNNLAGALYDLQGDASITGVQVYNSPFWHWYGGTFNNAGLFRKSAGSGTASIDSLVGFNNTGTVEVDSGTLSIGSFTQAAGLTDLKGGSLAFSSPAHILGGQLRGSGTISGSIVNSGGLLSPAHSSGAITINGNYTQGASATLLIELAGLGNGQFDVLDVSGTALLGGTLDLNWLVGSMPSYGDEFQIIGAGAVTGVFDSVNGFAVDPDKYLAVIYGPDTVKIVVAIPGDANLDGVVGRDDLLTLESRFGSPGGGWGGGDFNMDGQVTYLDYLTLKSHFGQSIPGGVPEPATISVLGLASLVLLVRRRGHARTR